MQFRSFFAVSRAGVLMPRVIQHFQLLTVGPFLLSNTWQHCNSFPCNILEVELPSATHCAVESQRDERTVVSRVYHDWCNISSSRTFSLATGQTSALLGFYAWLFNWVDNWTIPQYVFVIFVVKWNGKTFKCWHPVSPRSFKTSVGVPKCNNLSKSTQEIQNTEYPVRVSRSVYFQLDYTT